jgi:predicted component of type VI protein secretion system
MTGNHRIAWRQGMFLRPQHFQAQDRHVDSLVMARVHSVRPWAWGFTELTIDEDMASLGKFSAVRASGVMPDGTAFSIPDSMPPPEPLDVPEDARDRLWWQNGAELYGEEDAAWLEAKRGRGARAVTIATRPASRNGAESTSAATAKKASANGRVPAKLPSGAKPAARTNGAAPSKKAAAKAAQRGRARR